MKDVDILVKKGDWQRIKEIIARLGFQSESEFDILKLDTLIEIPVDWQLGFENNRGTKLEFKFYLYVLDFPIFEDTESYFKEAAPAVVAGVETLSLSIEDQILLLCCRLINVGFRNLLWFCDLREFLEHYRDKINWEKLIAKAKKKRITVFLYFSFLILKEQLAVGIAQEVINSLKPNFFRRWMFEYFYSYKSALFRIPQDIEWPNPLIGLGLVFGKIGFRVKNLTKALVYFKKLFFPAKEYIAYRYEKLVKNHSPKYFYYLRIKRLLSKLLLLAKIITEKIF